VLADGLLDRVEDGDAVDVAALAPRGDAADDLGAVVQALLGQVDRLPASDALDDEGELFCQED
jgi:hypothetical protein